MSFYMIITYLDLGSHKRPTQVLCPLFYSDVCLYCQLMSIPYIWILVLVGHMCCMYLQHSIAVSSFYRDFLYVLKFLILLQ